MTIKTTPIFRALVLAAATAFASQTAHASPILPGDLVNVRVGDGVTTPTGTALPVILDDYSVTYASNGAPASVTLQQSIALPTATTGTVPSSGNRYLTQGGTAAGEGGLALSTDGTSMSLAGYNQIVGGVTNPGSTGTEDRVAGILNLSTGTVDTKTDFSGFSGSTNGAAAARGAYVNGTTVYLASSVGVRAGTVDATNTSTGTAIAGTNNARRDVVFNGQLYESEAATNRSGIETIGTGTPTTTGQTISLLPGFSTTSGTYSDYDFWFANSTTLYIADDGSASAGLQKWTFNGTVWSMVYDHSIAAINPGGSTAVKGIKSLTGFLDSNGDAVMFASTVGTSNNLMLGLFDPAGNTSAANVAEDTLVTSNSLFPVTTGTYNLRGLAIAPGAVDVVVVPEPASLALAAIAAPMLLSRRRRSN